MGAPIRGDEETLIADATALAATSEISFDWDLTGAWYGEMTLEITFPSAGFGDVTVYSCPTAIDSPASGDYPTRLPLTGRPVGVVPGIASSTIPLTCYAGQGYQRIRIYNSGSSEVTLTKFRGRKYT